MEKMGKTTCGCGSGLGFEQSIATDHGADLVHAHFSGNFPQRAYHCLFKQVYGTGMRWHRSPIQKQTRFVRIPFWSSQGAAFTAQQLLRWGES